MSASPPVPGRVPGPGVAGLARAALILATLALFVSEHYVHYAMGAMALLGVVDLARHREDLRDPTARALGLLFALLWLPMAIAWPGAADRAHSGEVVWPYLHLLPAAWFVTRSCLDPAVRRLVTQGAALLVAFMAIDALIQFVWHVDLFGYPYKRGVLKGLFYPKQRLGLFLAVLAPLYVDTVLNWCRRHAWLWLLLVPMVVAVLMSQKRSAWIMLVFGALFHGLLWARRRRAHGARPRLLLATLLLGLALGLAALNPALRARLVDTSGVFSTDAATFDKASAYRLTLWRTGVRIFADHWLTGVGPRGFRHVYADYAPPDDFWLKRTGQGQTHPHQLMLEIAIETGVIGLAAFVAFYVLLLRRLLRAAPRDDMPVWLMATAVAWLPLNAHLAFYGAYWTALAWLTLAVGLAETRGADLPA